MNRGPMPTLGKIAEYWVENPDELEDVFPHMVARLDPGEPHCFACSFFPFVDDEPVEFDPARDRTYVDTWNRAKGLLEREHLHEVWAGGSNELSNLAPCCYRCHIVKPACRTRDEASVWYVAHEAAQRWVYRCIHERSPAWVKEVRSGDPIALTREWYDASVSFAFQPTEVIVAEAKAAHVRVESALSHVERFRDCVDYSYEKWIERNKMRTSDDRV